jgi:D-glycero-D-manno-heptose 1,7-bisphosphate phosphatase
MDLQRTQTELTNRWRPTIFFDRDGVLNHDEGYTYRIEDFQWITGAIEAIKVCNDHNWLVIVVTNQAGIARGYYEVTDVERLHDWMQEQLRTVGAHVDAFYYCPHHTHGVVLDFAIECICRKPEPGMLLRAMDEWPVDRNVAYLIGDKLTDLEAAHRADIKGLLFSGGNLLSLVKTLII